MAGCVVGVDVGTTAVKAVAYDPDGSSLAEARRGYELRSPRPGFAEQDADEIVDATLVALAEVADAAGTDIEGIGLSTVMHSLIGVDADRAPLTPSVTYADSRAWPQALRLRRDGIELYRATGTPIHPMAPLAKLRWFAEERPELTARVASWISIKEHLLTRLTGSTVVDRSVASATGLLDVSEGTWHDGALAAAGIRADQLGEPVATTHVVEGLRPDVAERVGLPATTPVVVGATDGVLANLGVGATAPGIAAATIGTSGAIRVAATEPRTDPRMRTFCYVLTEDLWVVGGAISNGGLVLTWLRDHVLGEDLEELTARAASVAPGSDGVLVLPYLTGERAPRWSPLRGGVVFGLQVEHGRGHVVRAAMEGVALQLRLVADAVREAGVGFDRIRVTGGFTSSDLWLQILADVLGVELELPRVAEGAAHGAALLARVGLGSAVDLADAAPDTEVSRTIGPDASAADRYDEVADRYAELVDRLAPLLREVTGVDPIDGVGASDSEHAADGEGGTAAGPATADRARPG